MLGTNPVIVTYNITGKHKYVQLGNPSLIWSYSAVNEAGISFTEESNNNPQVLDKENRNPLIDSEKVLWYASNINDVDSILKSFRSPNDFILNYGSAKENRATVYDMIGGEIKGKTEVIDHLCGTGGTRNRDIEKRFETIYSGMYHNMCRDEKFEELYVIDTTKNVIDKAINIISNTEFYNYTQNPEAFFESIHNYQTTQSVVFDASNNTVYFAYYPYFAGWSNWYKYNYGTGEVSLYKKQDPRLDDDSTKAFINACKLRNNVNWNKEKVRDEYAQTLEQLKTDHLFALKDLTTYYLFYNKDFAKAEIQINKMVSNYPDIVYGKYYQARLFHLRGEYDDAISAYNKALTVVHLPDYWKASIYENLADVSDKKGDMTMRKSSAIEALKIFNQYWTPENLQVKIDKLKKQSK